MRAQLLKALLVALLASCSKPDKPAPAAPLARCRQLVVVRSPEWASTAGTLQRYERKDRAAAWQPVGASVPVSLGRAGLAWGRGLHGEQQGLVKKEGDGRSPAGLFPLPSTFGNEPDQGGNLAYVQTTAETLCITDPKSLRYNRIVQRGEIQYPDWSTFERVDRYEPGIVIGHNLNPVQAGAGACVFLGVRKAAEASDGSTLAQAEAVLALARWLDWMAEPVLVQLPDSEYVRLRQAWGLP